MTGGAKTFLAFGQEVSFHLPAFVFTPRILHHHGSIAIIGGVGFER